MVVQLLGTVGSVLERPVPAMVAVMREVFRIWYLGRYAQVLPLEWMLGRRAITLREIEKLRRAAVCIHPGVHACLHSMGDVLLPDGRTERGAQVIVWSAQEVRG